MTTASSRLAGLALRHDPDALRQARMYAKLTQTELARLTGITQPYLSMLENGRHNPSEKLLARLAHFCGVLTGDLRARERAR